MESRFQIEPLEERIAPSGCLQALNAFHGLLAAFFVGGNAGNALFPGVISAVLQQCFRPN